MTQAAEWQTGKIDDVSEKVGIGPFGSSIRVNTFVPDGIPIISGQHLHRVKIDEAPGFNFITKEHAQRLANANVQRGDVVFTYAGNIGQASYIPEDSQFERYVISQRQFYMRCDRSKVIPEYVALYFKSPEGRHKLLANSSQVGVPMIARPVTYLRSIEIPIPPLPEQQAIAHALGTLDDKIELNRRMNRTLEEMARAIFKDWFVDFGPTRAKIEGQEPYLPPELWDLFPDQLVDSELGEIPEGWETKPLDEIATFLNGLAFQKYPPNEGPSLPVIKIAQLRAGHTQGADSASVDVPSKYHIHDGDVLFSWSGSLELDIWTGGEGALNQHLFKVDSDVYPKWLYYHWVREYLQVFRAIAADKATTMGHIQRRHLSESHTVLPDSAALEAMNRLMLPLLDKSAALRMTSRTVALLRDALLPQIMSGDISINLIGAA